MAFDGIAPGQTQEQPFFGSKSQAIDAGAKYYCDGKPCRRSHSPAVRRTPGGHCLQCEKITYDIWVNKNIEKIKEYRKNYCEKNKDKMNARATQWAKDNYGRHLDNCARWAREHPEAKKAADFRRRDKIRQTGSSITRIDYEELYDIQKGKCGWCGIKLKERYEDDHIIAVKNDGPSTRRNLILSCMPCNRSKGAKDPIDWVRKKFGKLL